YVSLEDNLMRLFGSEKMGKWMDRMGLQEGEVIQNKLITRSIERAQKKVEENNFGIRKRLLEYDDVMNAQREVIYERRHHALFGERLRVDIANMIFDLAETIAETNKVGEDFGNFEYEVRLYFSMDSPIDETTFKSTDALKIAGKLYNAAYENYQESMKRSAEIAFPVIKRVYEDPSNHFERIAVPFTDGTNTLNVATNLEKAYKTDGKQLVTDFEKNITLAIIDDAWKTHLRKMDDLKQSVQLAVHEQKDPLLIYKFEALELFKAMLDEVNKEVISFLFKGELPNQDNTNVQEAPHRPPKQNLQTHMYDLQTLDERAAQMRAASQQASQRPQVTESIFREPSKIGRNVKVTIKNV